MAIDLSRYVDITSGVGAGTVVNPRELIGRIFSINPLIPPGGVTLEFTTAAAVGTYFGLSSEEYARALFYFSWISKNITRPKKLGFCRWVNADVAPRIYGNVQTQTLAAWQLITAGSFKLTIGAVQNVFTSLNFSAAASLSDVATILQTAIRAVVTTTKSSTTTSTSAVVTMGSTTGLTAGMVVTGTGIPASTTILSVDSSTQITLSANATATGTPTLTFTDPVWGLATVIWDSTRGSFDFVGGATGANVISVQIGTTGTNIAAKIGWIYDSTLSAVNTLIIANGAITEAVTAALTQSANLSNNFGSFLFQPALTIEQIALIGAWNTEQNILYQYMVPVIAANVASYLTALVAYSGVAVTLSEISNQYPEMAPMMILAATDYLAANSVQNYMFQMFNLTYGVSTDTVADTMDTARVNYYGRTQTAGQFLDFYQRGILTGLPTAPTDMNTYANEQWLKDAAGAAVMTLLLALAKVSANVQGRSQILTTLQAVINAALNNGTISIGKLLTSTQKNYISEITNDVNAWYQVQNIGYWVDCVIREVVTESGAIEYVADYILVYSKDDVIRKVNGTHVLI